MRLHHYHWLLVALSVLLACAGSYVALTLIAHINAVTPRLRQFWRALTALTAGLTIWSMHFVGILACDFPVPIEFDPWLTLLSLAVAQFPTFLILQIIQRGGQAFGLLGAMLFGLGVVAMHFTGMAAMHGEMTMSYSMPWVIAAAVTAVVVSHFALRLLDPSRGQQRPLGRVASATLLGGAISSMHYLGMQAITIMPKHGELAGVSSQQDLLALLVGGASVLICVALLTALQVDRQLSLRGRKNAELHAQAALEEQRYWTVINALTEGVLIIDSQGHLLTCNDSARQIFDSDNDDLAMIQQLGLSHFYDSEGQHISIENMPGNRAIASGTILTDVQVMLQTPQGRSKWLSMNATPLPAAAGEKPGAVVSLKDITLERDYDRQLLHQAMHDELTSLPNRRQFNMALVRAIEHARTRHRRVGVVYFDLDHFKDVNDTLGHHIGDMLLQAITDRFKALLPAQALPARFGGDEFGILIPDIEDEEEVWDIAQRIHDALELPVTLENWELHVGVSIGFSVYPEDGTDMITLLKHADLAMNEVKANGRGGQQRFSPDHARQRNRVVEIERAMRSALGTEQFRLTYQPIYALQTRQLVSCEALMRWTHPELGVVSPADFIPIAEESGLVDWLGEWALRTACRQAKVWLDAGTPLAVAVNISMKQFRSGRLPDLVGKILQETQLDPRWLTVEVTETALMSNPDDVIVQLSLLREKGIRVALDDFGTGFSSLQLLQNLPIDKLKLDRTFLETVTINPRQQVMVEGIVALAHGLGLSVIAEGIEAEEQYQELLDMGCHMGQGYLLSRPQEVVDMSRLLQLSAKILLGASNPG